jgi:hypothetical protein
MKKNNISIEAANLILGETGESDKFQVRFWKYLKLNLSIPYLDANTIVRISRELSKVESPNVDADMFTEMMRTAKNLKFECRAIAIATGSWFPFLSRLIGKGKPKDIRQLLEIIKEKSDPEAFFLGIKLAKGLDKLKPRENLSAAKPSGDA